MSMKHTNFMKIQATALIICGLFLNSGCKSTDVFLPYGEDTAESKAPVQTQYGLVSGVYNSDNTVELFAGIPFAKPPVGDLRWKEPQDAENWKGVYHAEKFKPMAMQKQSSKLFTKLFNAYIHSKGDRTDFAPVSEDCLYLNIWRPANYSEKEKLPVLVYIHGGSLTSGSSWYERYDGEALARQGIITVNVSYRLGVFGYYAHESLAEESPNHTTGNYGLLDQIKALKWVYDNIENFSGDKNNITIAGESAGSSSVNAICVSPLAKGLFRRAIAESSSLTIPVPPHTFRTREDSIRIGEKIMEEFKATSISELRSIKAEKLITTKHLCNSMTVDGYALPEYPWEIYQKGLNNEEALLNGFNGDEGRAFTTLSKINLKNYRKLTDDSPFVTDTDGILSIKEVKTDKEAKDLYTDIFSAICFTYPHYSWTKTVYEQKKPVWEYCFNKTNIGISNMHSGELPYAFGNLYREKYFDEEDYKLSEIMQKYWLNFARYGNPNGDKKSPDYGKNLPYWEKAGEKGKYAGEVLMLDTEIKMAEDPFLPYYKYLNFDIRKEDRPLTFGRKEE